MVFKYKFLVLKVIGSMAFDLSQGISQKNDTNKPAAPNLIKMMHKSRVPVYDFIIRYLVSIDSELT